MKKMENEDRYVTMTIYGEPMGKQRPKFSTAGKFIRTYTPKATASYESFVKMVYHEGYDHMMFPDGKEPLYIHITAGFKIPKSTSKKRAAQMKDCNILPTKKPDWDNIGKIITDALNGVAYHDDAQIVQGTVDKIYSEEPFVTIAIGTVHCDDEVTNLETE